MHIKEETLDDLLNQVISLLLRSKDHITASRGGFTEITGVLLELTNPLARLSRTERKTHVFSSLGELVWYLSGSNAVDFITYYVPRYSKESDDGKTVHAGYGPRLFGMDRQDQIRSVITLLSRRPTSRQAVVQLFDAADIAESHAGVPCTCTLQFLMRDSRLHMVTYMRSNDAFLGLPHDIFAFTMLQELIARSLGTPIGSYKHAVGSLHLYDEHRVAAEEYLGEGIQPRIGVAMPAMPDGDPWSAVACLVAAEARIRAGDVIEAEELGIAPYWQDLVRLLQVFRHFKCNDVVKIAELLRLMSSPVYTNYIEQKRKTAAKRGRQNKND